MRIAFLKEIHLSENHRKFLNIGLLSETAVAGAFRILYLDG